MIKKIICVCTLFLFFISGCQNDTDNSLPQGKPSSSLDTAQIQKSLLTTFDAINGFYELTEDDLLIFGFKDNHTTAVKYELDTGKVIHSKNEINYGYTTQIGILNDGFYITDGEMLFIYDNNLALLQKVNIPNLELLSLTMINPLTTDRSGEKLYYTIENDDFSSSLIEMDIKSKKKKTICTYNNKTETLAMIEAMTILKDGTLLFLGQSYPSADSQSQASYGTIDLSTGRIQDTILDLSTLQTGRDIAVIAAKDDPYNTNKTRDYVLLYDDGSFKKIAANGAENVKACSENTFLTHEIKLADDNTYSTYRTYIYQDSKLLQEIDQAGEFVYEDYITDFYMSKYHLYFQSVLTEKDELKISVSCID